MYTIARTLGTRTTPTNYFKRLVDGIKCRKCQVSNQGTFQRWVHFHVRLNFERIVHVLNVFGHFPERTSCEPVFVMMMVAKENCERFAFWEAGDDRVDAIIVMDIHEKQSLVRVIDLVQAPGLFFEYMGEVF